MNEVENLLCYTIVVLQWFLECVVLLFGIAFGRMVMEPGPHVHVQHVAPRVAVMAAVAALLIAFSSSGLSFLSLF